MPLGITYEGISDDTVAKLDDITFTYLFIPNKIIFINLGFKNTVGIYDRKYIACPHV